MRVNEIFYSIEGEGIRAGMPCVFIRLFGCNLHCSYCDTRYSCEGDDYRNMTVEEIIGKVAEFECKNITVTGGEPLIHENIDELLMALANEGYYVNVETNGSVVPTDHAKRWGLHFMVFYTVDFKTISSGETDKMKLDAFKNLSSDDVVKFVVGSAEDLEQARRFVQENDIKAHIFVSPIFGKIELQEIAHYLMSYHLSNWRMQLQIHKYIWSPETRGV